MGKIQNYAKNNVASIIVVFTQKNLVCIYHRYWETLTRNTKKLSRPSN